MAQDVSGTGSAQEVGAGDAQGTWAQGWDWYGRGFARTGHLIGATYRHRYGAGTYRVIGTRPGPAWTGGELTGVQHLTGQFAGDTYWHCTSLAISRDLLVTQ